MTSNSNSNSKTEKLKEYLFFSAIAFTLTWVGWRYYNDEQSKKRVSTNHSFVIGYIIKYGSVGSVQNYYLTYNYTVDEQAFDVETSLPNDIFSGCKYDLNLCSNKRFWVAYEKDDPSNSLINLYIEIQGFDDPVPPETLDDFR